MLPNVRARRIQGHASGRTDSHPRQRPTITHPGEGTPVPETLACHWGKKAPSTGLLLEWGHYGHALAPVGELLSVDANGCAGLRPG